MFMEFMRNALRMSALMKIGTIYVYTHDSIGLGEDGPTHQPVEQLATMRAIPNFQTWRGSDAIESAVSWKMAMLRGNAPTALVFSRQNLTPMERTAEQLKNIEKGGYVLKDCDGDADLIMIATGSEVGLAVESAEAMSGTKIRVVSMPSTDAYDEQDQAYKDSVLTPGVKRIAIEAGVDNGWHKYVGLEGDVVCMSSFGESAPAGELFKQFGFTVENVVATAKKVLK
jgi:transketolase